MERVSQLVFTMFIFTRLCCSFVYVRDHQALCASSFPDLYLSLFQIDIILKDLAKPRPLCQPNRSFRMPAFVPHTASDSPYQ
jgi:hypothetical protein